MNSNIVSIGTAVPVRSIAQADAAEIAVRLGGGENGTRAMTERLYRNTKVERRGSVLLEEEALSAVSRVSFFDGTERGPTTAGRLKRYTEEATPLAKRACEEALQRAGRRAKEITHLVTVSCTGMSAPGVDCGLIETMEMAPSVQRTNIGFMGCYGAITGLRTAGAIAAAEPGSVVLMVCIELCSLHFQKRAGMDQMVANALFSDGAGAAVVEAGRGGRRIAASGSVLLEGSKEMMSWQVGDHGFQMTLSARVPDVIRSQLGGWMRGWLGAAGVSVAEIAKWAVHPGGPRVLDAVEEALGLDTDALETSRAVLAGHGNMSSATVLFVLDRLNRERGEGWSVLLAFGPGLAAEGLLVA